MMTLTAKCPRAGYLVSLFLVVVVCFISMPGVMSAQVTYGGFRGVVTDATGAPVPRVSITVTSKAKGFTRTVVSDSEGNYEMPSLPEDTYTLTAEATGFKKYVNEDVVLYARDLRRVDIALEVGQVTESI